jgi:hypothetical protein
MAASPFSSIWAEVSDHHLVPVHQSRGIGEQQPHLIARAAGEQEHDDHHRHQAKRRQSDVSG